MSCKFNRCVAVGLVACLFGLASGCAGGGFKMTANPTPKEKWSESEETFLTNVRQLTLADMGLTKSGEAYFSPDLKRVIFQAFPAGEHEYQMYTIELDEAGNALRDSLHRISPPGGACTCGNFRPDGEKLIYASSYLNPNVPNPNKYHREGSTYKWDMPGGMDVIEANIDGSEPKQLTQQLGYDAECAYSPDGKQIVFSSDRDGDPDLYIMSADGTDVRQLTNKPGYDGGPFFSPDGKKVIFRADRKQDDHLQIFVINTDGTGEKQLTSHSDVVNWAPYWLPDGRSIVFATSVHGHYNYEVYYLDIRTGRFHRITYSPGFDGLPVISHDGKWMMWTSQRTTDGQSQVFLADFKKPQ